MSRQVESGDHTGALVLTNSNTNFLYQAYVGRVTGSAIEVFVDDEPIVTGTANTQAGNTVRSWYEGVSYASVEPLKIVGVVHDPVAPSVTLTWNSLPAEKSLTIPSYSVWRKNSLDDPMWILVATGLPSGGNSTSFMHSPATSSQAYYRVTRP